MTASNPATAAINPYVGLAPCRLSNTSTENGSTWTYFNGINNNGLGATISSNSGNFSIDGITPVAGDRILINLSGSPQNLMNGIYTCITPSLLMRSADFQLVSQLQGGAFTFIYDGNTNKGLIGVVTTPFPLVLGQSSAVTFVLGATLTPSTTSNRETISADKTLIASSAQYQFLNPIGADRSVILPVPTVNMSFFIKNTSSGTQVLNIQQNGGGTIGNFLAGGIGSGYYYDGSGWQVI